MPRVYVKKGGNGGRRPGAGRPKGSISKKDSLLHVKSLREKYPLLPLEHMLRELNDEEADTEHRTAMAKAAAPYVHPRLVQRRAEMPTRYSLDTTKLSDDELVLFERLMAKAQIPL